MAQTNVNIRMDSDLKTQFEAFCTDMGMTMTTTTTRTPTTMSRRTTTTRATPISGWTPTAWSRC